MKKLNNKGFVLVETLIVAAFVAGILAVLYNNLYPLIGEYEKREVYDDIDGKYATYWIKRVIQHNSVTFVDASGRTFTDPNNYYQTSLKNDGYFTFQCNMVVRSDPSQPSSMEKMCDEIVKKTQIMVTAGVPHIYVTRYALGDRGTDLGFKTLIDNTSTFTSGLHKYVNHLPEYKFDSLNGANYRVIVEFHRKHDGNDYLAYSTFEVIK